MRDHHHAHGDVCAHAHAHAARADTALGAVMAACAARGVRLTAIRRRILEALYATHRPLGAYDIIAALTKAGERPLAPITVYRALDFLIGNGFAHRLASRNAFLACPFGHAPGSPVVFLICEACGGVDESEAEDVKTALAGLAGREGFAVTAPVIELSGRCAHCRPAAERRRA